jgi:large repetitive protein
VTTFTTGIPVGSQQIQVTPMSKFTPPIAGANTGSTATLGVTSVGSPFYTGSTSAAPSGTSITVTGPVLNANYSALATSQVWVAWVQGATPPTCAMDGSEEAVVSGAGLWTSPTNTIAGLQANTNYLAAVCGSNGFGAALTAAGAAFTWVPPAAPSGTTTYEIASTPNIAGATYTFGLASGPALDPLPGFAIFYWYNGGGKSLTFEPGFNAGVDITAAHCLNADTSLCGAAVDIDPVAGTPTSKVQVVFPTACVVLPSESDVGFVGANAGTDANVSIASGTDYQVTWIQAPFLGLASITHPINMCIDEGGGGV